MGDQDGSLSWDSPDISDNKFVTLESQAAMDWWNLQPVGHAFVSYHQQVRVTVPGICSGSTAFESTSGWTVTHIKTASDCSEVQYEKMSID